MYMRRLLEAEQDLLKAVAMAQQQGLQREARHVPLLPRARTRTDIATESLQARAHRAATWHTTGRRLCERPGGGAL